MLLPNIELKILPIHIHQQKQLFYIKLPAPVCIALSLPKDSQDSFSAAHEDEGQLKTIIRDIQEHYDTYMLGQINNDMQFRMKNIGYAGLMISMLFLLYGKIQNWILELVPYNAVLLLTASICLFIFTGLLRHNYLYWLNAQRKKDSMEQTQSPTSLKPHIYTGLFK